MTELSEKIGVSRVTISHWKQRNSINPVKKKCVELGIYDNIFNSDKQMKFRDTHGNTAYNNNGIQVQKEKDVSINNKDFKICDDESLRSLLKDACTKAEKSEEETEKLKKIIGKYLYA
jgi:hypothetical protein